MSAHTQSICRTREAPPASSVAAVVSLLLAGAAPATVLAQESSALEEITVTAQRRSQNIMDVPLSVTGYTAAQMEAQGIRSIDDVARLTPSLRFTKTSGVSGNNGSDISIRGIASDVGSATTAIYIDETPIQIRSIGYFGGNTYPLVSDLERIEVLRGPQGTLFGAGAEGGAVRFITPQPNFANSSLAVRTELATIRNGGTNYEAGVAGGAPISDSLAFRGSVWFRHEGGYIDRYDSATGTQKVGSDINASDNYSGRAAIAWKATEALTLTPSVYYQKTEADGRDQYWESRSNIGSTDYRTGIYNPEPSTDRFVLPALKVEYDFGAMTLIANSSYFDRSREQALDYATFLSANRTGNPFGTYANKDATNAVAYQTLDQQNLVQEVRLQSGGPEQRVDWTAGLYYSKADQDSLNQSGSGRIPGVISSGFPQYLGRFNLYDAIEASDKQYAVFASADFKVTPNLTATVGGRFSRNEFDYVETRDGPVNGGRRTSDAAGQKDDAFTPRLAASYKFGDDNMVYAAASKGFRPGGAQAPVDPTFCAADLATLGLTSSPREFDSDSLWSYELGSKSRTLGGALTVDVNAYYVNWDNIQQSIRLPRCSFAFIANLGKATAKGADLALSIKPVEALQLGGSFGYNNTEYDDPIIGGNGLVIKQAGDRIGGPRWTGAVYALGEMPVGDTVRGYVRLDYTFQSSGIPPNPATFGYDPGLTTLPSTNSLAVRVGARFEGFDVSAFVNNLTNSNEALARTHDTIGSALYYAQSYTPRTIGVTATYRY